MAVDRSVYLYGAICAIPPDWVDQTSYLFESDEPPLRSVAFAREIIPPAQAERWLLDKAHAIIDSFPRAKVNHIHRYPNAEFLALGFEAELGDAERKQQAALVVLAREEGSLAIVAKALPGDLDSLKFIVASLRVATAPPAPGQYFVYEFSFSSQVPLRLPRQFAFASPDYYASLSCRWAESNPEFGDPEWLQPFGLPLDVEVTVHERSESELVGRAPDATSHAAPLIQQRRTLAVAARSLSDDGETAPHELYFAEAKADRFASAYTRAEEAPARAPNPSAAGRNVRYLYFRFACQGGFGKSAALWRNILGSLAWED